MQNQNPRETIKTTFLIITINLSSMDIGRIRCWMTNLQIPNTFRSPSWMNYTFWLCRYRSDPFYSFKGATRRSARSTCAFEFVTAKILILSLTGCFTPKTMCTLPCVSMYCHLINYIADSSIYKCCIQFVISAIQGRHFTVQYFLIKLDNFDHRYSSIK